MSKLNLLYIGNKLSKHGFNPTGVEYTSEILREKYNVRNCSDKLNPILRVLDIVKEIIVQRQRIDFFILDLYSTNNFYVSVLAVWLIRLLRGKYILLLRGGDLPNRFRTSNFLSRNILSKSFKNVAPSYYLINVFASYNISVEYIPNSIPLDKYKFKKRSDFSPRLLYVRAFHKIYNPSMAIEVVRKLKAADMNVTLTMVGPDKDGSMVDCKKLVEKYCLGENIVFTGILPKEKWISLSEDYNVFINTTNYDNTPVSVIEAMCLGLLVISTDVGGIRYLIDDGVNGILVPPGKPDMMVEKLLKVFSNPAKYVDIPINARKSMEEFKKEKVLETWGKLLENSG